MHRAANVRTRSSVVLPKAAWWKSQGHEQVERQMVSVSTSVKSTPLTASWLSPARKSVLLDEARTFSLRRIHKTGHGTPRLKDVGTIIGPRDWLEPPYAPQRAAMKDSIVACSTRNVLTHAKRKKYAPKVRTGCGTCKIRRVKCDEARPICRRCETTGRKCDGYDAQNKDNKSSETFSPTPALTTDTCSDALEKRALHYFRHRTAPMLSPYCSETAWNYSVLQLGQAEPAVRHAAISLGALHETKALRLAAERAGYSGQTLLTNYHDKQYAKALKSLQILIRLPNTNLDVVVACSLLLVHFEALRESYAAAIVHLDNGLKLLHSPNTTKVERSLVRALMRIDDQGALYTGMTLPSPTSPLALDAMTGDIPAQFKSIDIAVEYINTCVCCSCYFTLTEAHKYRYEEPGDVPLELIARSQTLVRTFSRLDERLTNDFQSANSTLREDVELAGLRVWTRISRIDAATCLYGEASVFDLYLQDFTDALTHCKSILDSCRNNPSCADIPLDQSVLFPLFYIATRCRDSKVRKQALALLRQLRTNETGIWNCHIVTNMAQECIELEEATCEKDVPECSDILEMHRIHAVEYSTIQVRENVRRIERKYHMRPNGMDGEWEVRAMVKEVNTTCLAPDDVRRKPNRPVSEQPPSPAAKKSPATHIPARPFEIWWASPVIVTSQVVEDGQRLGTKHFDTTPYRLAYFSQQAKRMFGEG